MLGGQYLCASNFKQAAHGCLIDCTGNAPPFKARALFEQIDRKPGF